MRVWGLGLHGLQSSGLDVKESGLSLEEVLGFVVQGLV